MQESVWQSALAAGLDRALAWVVNQRYSMYIYLVHIWA